MSLRIKDTDHGYKRLLADAKRAAKGAGVSVGVHAKEGSEPKKAEDGDEEPLTVLDVAIINEFGGELNNPPERSFLRTWVDQNQSTNAEALRQAVKLVLKGSMPLEQALELVGLKMAGGIQQAISQETLGLKPNAESTVERKGSSKPLVDTGQLRQSITHLVRGPKPPT